MGLAINTHNLPIKVVFLDHDSVDSFGVFEREEAEPARSAGGAVPHYSALQNLTKL